MQWLESQQPLCDPENKATLAQANKAERWKIKGTYYSLLDNFHDREYKTNFLTYIVTSL